MDAGLKQRLIGAAVLVALAVIFLPMLVKGPAPDSGVSDLSMRVPDAPDGEYRTVDLPLVVPADAPQGGVLGSPEPIDGDPLPTVDTANPPPDAPRPARGEAPAETPAPEEPVATPATPAEPMRPAATGGGDYVVHFGAFANERDAQLIVRQLSGAGLTAYSEPFDLDGKPAQRVRLGPYASREAAEAIRVRAAQVRGDVTPRVVALDAPAATPRRPQPQPVATRPADPPKPVEAPKPAAATPAAPAAASGGFSVQVGAFSNAAEATKLRDRLRGLGITAFTDTVNTDKGRLTRVKAGPVPDRQDAERLKAQVQARAGLDGMVRPHP
ncbi:sporulation protein [Luteimonas viscosa]|uniref:Sporulation protein n=1 Tax=Luteimonas viscosa TaxID=1132694 RepID=A0A5D4XNG5_9GAMM|nr:SPOR domain-containing protein [Luteimonas viscosa]TYT25341.1 sporulation protein [Luteimonas viscosa]